MQERKINFERNDDPNIVVDPNGDIAKKINKIYQNLKLNLGFCYDQLVAGKLTEGMKETHLSLSEAYMVDFLSEMNYDSIIKKEKDSRYLEIRSLNDENRQLRRQLGEKVSNEDVREKIKIMSQVFSKWWSMNGFGHVSNSDLTFSQYRMRVNLSGHIFCSRYEGGMSVKEKIEHFGRLGFDIDDEQIIASDNSTQILLKLLKSRFPRADIYEMNIIYNSFPKYQNIIVEITDFNDLI
ncbi:MAG: hypothetical protein JXA99_02160 [Candidatus Lokiarchaeota archaeon]|nr:hypothetical protein [Candidatus Lokiarchaeota archaeon]